MKKNYFKVSYLCLDWQHLSDYQIISIIKNLTTSSSYSARKLKCTLYMIKLFLSLIEQFLNYST